jgi:hypothetical protein
MLQYIDHLSSRDAFDLTILTSGSSVTVKAGSCTIGGSPCAIPSDTTYAVVSSGDITWVTCFLILDPSTPTAPQVVFTDNLGAPPSNLYYRLLSFVVPPGSTDATTLDIVVHRTTTIAPAT